MAEVLAEIKENQEVHGVPEADRKREGGSQWLYTCKYTFVDGMTRTVVDEQETQVKRELELGEGPGADGEDGEELAMRPPPAKAKSQPKQTKAQTKRATKRAEMLAERSSQHAATKKKLKSGKDKEDEEEGDDEDREEGAHQEGSGKRPAKKRAAASKPVAALKKEVKLGKK